MSLPSGIDWRLGEWQRQMRDVTGDMLLADAPYGKRTHEGYRTGSDASDESGIDNYGHWTPDHVSGALFGTGEAPGPVGTRGAS